jgi:HPt (histidine-containing phosphotransfer) domain-containing protein
LPIIAMTAAVLKNDRDACLAAGMNDHVAKPIQPDELRAALIKYIKPLSQEPQEALPPAFMAALEPVPVELPGFAFRNVLEILDGNQERLKELLLQFAAQFEEATQEVASLIREGQRQEAAGYLHQLKGAAANLGATALRQAVATLEGQLKSGAPLDGQPVFEQVMAETLASIASFASSGETVRSPVQPGISPEACETCDWPRARNLMRQMREVLEGNGFIPHGLMSELKETVRCEPLHKQLALLERQVADFKYADALETLNSLECPQGHPLQG